MLSYCDIGLFFNSSTFTYQPVLGLVCVFEKLNRTEPKTVKTEANRPKMATVWTKPNRPDSITNRTEDRFKNGLDDNVKNI